MVERLPVVAVLAHVVRNHARGNYACCAILRKKLCVRERTD